MRTQLRGISLVLMVLMAIGTLAGLFAAKYRLMIEAHNRLVEIGLEWQEVSTLAQSLGMSPAETLTALDEKHHIHTLILQEDTITQLEQTGAIQANSQITRSGKLFTTVMAASPKTLERIQKALELHGFPVLLSTSAITSPVAGTIFTTHPTESRSLPEVVYVPIDYAQLRTLGLGLPQDGIDAAKAAHMRIAGRIGNFPGVTRSAAEKVLKSLRDQMTQQQGDMPLVIFSGEEVLGYRGMEKEVAPLLRDPNAPKPKIEPAQKAEAAETGETADKTEPDLPPLDPIGLTYGAVEFSKQKGDEKLSAALHGDYVRVHSIQTGEMAQLDENEAIERFVRAAHERNIRFCYVRLLTFAGEKRLERNARYLSAIEKGILAHDFWMGGGLGFGNEGMGARRYPETGTPSYLYPLIALGVAAGTVWMLTLLAPLPERAQWRLLALLALACVGMVVAGHETGRKLIALLAGIVFPAAACLYTFPRKDRLVAPPAVSRCMGNALSLLTIASLITGAGIAHVIGLLSTRIFMVHAEQFLGIKAQHAVPLFLVLLAALLGGIALPKETWEEFKARAGRSFRSALNEPARFGTLILFILAIAALALVVARTGNDAGVGVSGFELKTRAILDRILPVRPRTKEFLVGHPLFVLGVAWWLRGRRKLALPCFVAGSLGQVSLLNTFCHIHTPLIVSAWRDIIGLVLGALIGLAVFWLVERLLPPPDLHPERPAGEEL